MMPFSLISALLLLAAVGLIQTPMVSWTNRSKRDLDTFSQFQKKLITLYPRIHATLKR